MHTYTLWVLSEPLGHDVLLAAELGDGTLVDPTLARDPTAIHRFLAARGIPLQIAANVSTGVRLLREAEPRLFRVPASILKPKELVGPIVSLLLRGYAR